jgi:hypothetical protein
MDIVFTYAMFIPAKHIGYILQWACLKSKLELDVDFDGEKLSML